MRVPAKIGRYLASLTLVGTGMLPELVLAHGTDHLHFWGRHLDEVLPIPTILALLAMGALGWWLARDRR